MRLKWLPSYGEMTLNNSRASQIALNTTLHKVGSYPGYQGLTILSTSTPDHTTMVVAGMLRVHAQEKRNHMNPPNNVLNEMMRDEQVKAFEFNTRNSRGPIDSVNELLFHLLREEMQ
ncbi:unnamed protein product [Calypogeia fissa]